MFLLSIHIKVLAGRQREHLVILEEENEELNERMFNLKEEKKEFHRRVIYIRGELEVHSAQLKILVQHLAKTKGEVSKKMKEIKKTDNCLADLSTRFLNLNLVHDEKVKNLT